MDNAITMALGLSDGQLCVREVRSQCLKRRQSAHYRCAHKRKRRRPEESSPTFVLSLLYTESLTDIGAARLRSASDSRDAALTTQCVFGDTPLSF
jgi:hypothetical protein